MTVCNNTGEDQTFQWKPGHLLSQELQKKFIKFSNHEKLRLTCSKENKNCCTSDYFPVLPVWVKRYNFKFRVFTHLCVSPNFWVAIPGFWGGLLARVVARVGGKQGSGILRSGIFSLWLQCLLIGNHKENHNFTIICLKNPCWSPEGRDSEGPWLW